MDVVGAVGVKVELLGLDAPVEERDVAEELADIGAEELVDIEAEELIGSRTASHFLSLNTPAMSSSSLSVSETSLALRRTSICWRILLPATQCVSSSLLRSETTKPLMWKLDPALPFWMHCTVVDTRPNILILLPAK